MRVWTELKSFKKENSDRPLLVALGNFDGVHLGHQRILQTIREQAKRKGGTPAVLTFFEHPQRVLHQQRTPALLTSPQHRLFLFQKMGVEVCFLLHFTLEFSKTDPESFVQKWLVERLGVSGIHLGYNAHFGFGRSGDGQLMRQLAKRFGFDFFEAEPVKVGNEFVSSTLIRKAIEEGNLAETERFLGRPFSLFASVVRGKGRGRRLGFPTANLQPHSEILPPKGVYPIEVRESIFHLRPIGSSGPYEYELEAVGEWRPGILNYGTRPTFGLGDQAAIPEVHIFDFDGDLLGKTLEVQFHHKLRDERVFQNTESLAKAIEKDVAQAQEYFRSIRTH